MYTKATYAIDLNETNENDTKFFLTNLVNIELDVYFSNDSQNAAYWKEVLEDESIKDKIAQGSIKIEQQSNNHINITYIPDLNDSPVPHSLFTHIPENELVFLTLSDKVMSVNIYPPTGLENISNVIKDGVNQKSLHKERKNNVLNEQQIIEKFFRNWSNELNPTMHHGISFTNTNTFDIFSPLEFTADLPIENIEVIDNNTIQLFTSEYYSNVSTKVELSLNEDGTINYTIFSIDNTGDETAYEKEILFKEENN